MEATATSAMHVIKKEDKHAVLRTFIEQDLEARRRVQVDGEQSNCYYIIARSPASPVARAVAEIADEAARFGIKIFAVFAFANARSPSQRGHSDSPTDTSGARLIKDSRLLDAHEALLLSNGAAWVGDCMRRDPSQNDAYERFSTNCAFTGASVQSAFEQLWTGARAVSTDWISEARGAAQSQVSDAELIARSTLSPHVEQISRVPSTRH